MRMAQNRVLHKLRARMCEPETLSLSRLVGAARILPRSHGVHQIPKLQSGGGRERALGSVFVSPLETCGCQQPGGFSRNARGGRGTCASEFIALCKLPK